MPTDEEALLLLPPIMNQVLSLYSVAGYRGLTVVIDRVLPRAISLQADKDTRLPRLRLGLDLAALGDGLCRDGTRPHPEAEEGAGEERAPEDIRSIHHTSLVPR